VHVVVPRCSPIGASRPTHGGTSLLAAPASALADKSFTISQARVDVTLARTGEVLMREDVTLAGSGTVFHLAYLEAQRQRSHERIFPHVRSFPGGGAPKPPQLHFDIKAEFGGEIAGCRAAGAIMGCVPRDAAADACVPPVSITAGVLTGAGGAGC